MNEFITLLTSPLGLVFLVGGGLLGLFIVWWLRRRGAQPLPPAAQPLLSLGGGLLGGGLLGLLLLYLLSWGTGGGAPALTGLTATPSPTPTDRITATATMTPTLTATATRPRPTATAVMRLSPTPDPSPTITVTATLTPTVTATPPPSLPNQFEITITGDDETTCGYPDFTFDYEVRLETDTITLVQLVNGLTATGSYEPASGAFRASVGGLPGTEIFDGRLSAEDTIVRLDGTYTYVEDPNQACEGVWTIRGETDFSE